MRIASKTDIGRLRRTNQHAYACGELLGGSAAWAVVCDGMGGANGGNIASSNAVKVVSERIASGFRSEMSANSVKNLLVSAVCAANINVFDMAKSIETLSGMGTTIVAAILTQSVLYVVHAGDSRCYVISENEMIQLTRDHSIVQMMVECGQITPQEAKVHPKKNVITRALGVEEMIEVDFDAYDVRPDDKILICTDGLTNFMEHEEILSVIQQENFYEYADRLIDGANQNGGGDNITVVVISQ